MTILNGGRLTRATVFPEAGTGGQRHRRMQKGDSVPFGGLSTSLSGILGGLQGEHRRSFLRNLCAGWAWLLYSGFLVGGTPPWIPSESGAIQSATCFAPSPVLRRLMARCIGLRQTHSGLRLADEHELPREPQNPHDDLASTVMCMGFNGSVQCWSETSPGAVVEQQREGRLSAAFRTYVIFLEPPFVARRLAP